MTGNTKTFLAGGGLIAAVLLYLFYNKRKAAATATAQGGGSGGGFAPTMAVGGIPLVNYDGHVIAIVPVENNETTNPSSTSCQPPVLDTAFINAQNHLMVEWVPQGSNYNAVTVQTSTDNGASWANSTTGYNQTPLDMGTSLVNHAVSNSIDNIRVRVYGNCSDGKQTAVSNTIIIPIT